MSKVSVGQSLYVLERNDNGCEVKTTVTVIFSKTKIPKYFEPVL